ncbi:uncharacterized protein LOC123038081 [Drosophila rhopaloa]|uniref:Chitin synthase export chaperone n=1 Tax=Drosophila rhopaloa TaxID=1041015 RepID=A0ABM5JFI0_DRORH|nr:uncharacterized protein LOC123038081 [Drosophila rhopaloa]
MPEGNMIAYNIVGGTAGEMEYPLGFLERCRKIFRHFEIYCSATCSVAGILFTMFVFNENLRSKKIFSRAVAFLIVELLVFSMFVLIARTWIPDQMAFYFFCVLLMVVALIVGCHLSFTMDMTQYIAPLFLMSFILVTISIYFLVVNNFMEKLKPYAYLIFEICLTSVMTLCSKSVMLHAQTISGDRMVQMSSDDSLLAALFLFNEFLAVYAMTFYWQINYNYFTSTDFLWMSTSTKHSHDTTPI